VSVTRARGTPTASPPALGDVEVFVANRLAGGEAELADVTAQALTLFGDAAAAQERLRSEVVRLVLLGVLATAVASAGLCLATLVLVART
jgi:hypothetical protein